MKQTQYLYLQITSYDYYPSTIRFSLEEKVLEDKGYEKDFDFAIIVLPFYSRETAIDSLKQMRDVLKSKINDLSSYMTNSQLNDFIGCLENKTLDVWENVVANSLWLANNFYNAVDKLHLLTNRDNCFSVFGGFQMLFKDPDNFQKLVTQAKKRETLAGKQKELCQLNRRAGILKKQIAKMKRSKI